MGAVRDRDLQRAQRVAVKDRSHGILPPGGWAFVGAASGRDKQELSASSVVMSLRFDSPIQFFVV